jgi:hypothetical protein
MVASPSNTTLTTRMFNQPRLLSFLALDNTQTLQNVSIMTFLLPYYQNATYVNYSAYQQSQFLASYTMYDYVTSSGVINYTPFTSVSNATSGATYTTSYNGTVSGSTITKQEQIQIALNSTYGASSTPSGIAATWSVTDVNLQNLKNIGITSAISVFNSNPSLTNNSGFNNVKISYSNITNNTLNSITLILFRSGVYVGETKYSSPASYKVSNTLSDYLITVSNNLSTVLQGNYTIMAVSNMSNSTYGNFNIFSTLAFQSVNIYPTLNNVFTGSNNQVRLQVNNNLNTVTSLSIDGTPIANFANSPLQSRPVNAQLTNNSNTKTFIATLSNGINTNSYNVSIGTPGTANTLITPVNQTEYYPPLVVLPPNGSGPN